MINDYFLVAVFFSKVIKPKYWGRFVYFDTSGLVICSVSNVLISNIEGVAVIPEVIAKVLRVYLCYKSD